MMSDGPSGLLSRDFIDSLKQVSGRNIERARRREHITQAVFAREVGLSVRWLREVEGGNPAPSLDDHLLCAQRLGLPFGQVLFPLLSMSRGKFFPLPLAGYDSLDLDARVVELIAERNSRIVRDFLGLDPGSVSRGA